MFDAKSGDSWNDSKGKISSSTAIWVDRTNEERRHAAYSDRHGEKTSADTRPYGKLKGQECWNEEEARDATMTENEKPLRFEDDYHQWRKDSRSHANDWRKRGKVWSEPGQTLDFEGEWAAQQPREETLQSSAKLGSDCVTWRLPKDKLTSGCFNSCRNVMAYPQIVGQQDSAESPSLPGSWPQSSPALGIHYQQKISKDNHRLTSPISQQAEDIPISTTRGAATFMSSPVQQYWGSSRLATNPASANVDGLPAPAIARIERVSTLPKLNGSRFHNDRPYPRSTEATSKLSLSGAGKPAFDSRIGQFLFPALPKADIWRRSISHQVQFGQLVAYSHKMATPKYMDSHESPYAVFVFQYRSRRKSLYQLRHALVIDFNRSRH